MATSLSDRWESADPEFLAECEIDSSTKKLFPHLASHLWIKTSGSSGTQKWVALAKEAILSSASSVNSFLHSDQRDIWGATLPEIHVGGLSILARAYLSGAKVIECRSEAKWSPQSLLINITKHQITLISLVPTQLHDFVSLDLQAPSSLRAVFIGGGRLSEELRLKAISLGWPLVVTYGMTETASQICASEIGRPEMRALSHAQIKINKEGLIIIKARSLFSGYGVFADEKVTFEDPKEDGWFKTSDIGELNGGVFKWLGRADRSVKFKGILVNLDQLEAELIEFLPGKLKESFFLHFLPDLRTENEIVVVTSEDLEKDMIECVERFQSRSYVAGGKLKVFTVPEMKRTSIGKFDRIKTLSSSPR